MSKKQRARDEDGVDGEERQKEREREGEARENDAARGAVRRARRSEEGEEAGHCAIRKWLTTYTRAHG